VLKVQHKPIKRLKLGFKIKEQKKPKSTLVWRTGLSGVPPDSVRCATGQCSVHQRTVRCTRAIQVELLTFGFLRRLSAIIHRTVRCAKRSNGHQRNDQLQRSADNVNSARRVRAESEQHHKAHRTVNSVCPVLHRTVRCTKKSELQRSKPSEP
jgi:hypothetical protein